VLLIGYFLFARADKDQGFKEGKLTFNLTIEPVKGSTRWIPKAICDAKKCFDQNIAPEASKKCEFCTWTNNTSL